MTEKVAWKLALARKRRWEVCSRSGAGTHRKYGTEMTVIQNLNVSRGDWNKTGRRGGSMRWGWGWERSGHEGLLNLVVVREVYQHVFKSKDVTPPVGCPITFSILQTDNKVIFFRSKWRLSSHITYLFYPYFVFLFNCLLSNFWFIYAIFDLYIDIFSIILGFEILLSYLSFL